MTISEYFKELEEVLHHLRGGIFVPSEVYFGNASMSELLKSTLPWLMRVTLWARKKQHLERDSFPSTFTCHS